jgi:hypothetical protein
VFLLSGCALFAVRAFDLWRNPYQVGRVWQSFDIAQELERVHGAPWATELSTMTGGNSPAPFVQEFPFAQYAALLLKRTTELSFSEAGQAVAQAIAVAGAAVWLRYAWLLPASPPTRLLVGGAIFFVPGFLRYGATAVPDALVFLMNLGGAAWIATGRRQKREGLVTLGAALVGLGVLAKGTAIVGAAVIGFALLSERRWRAVAGLCAAALPGLAWAGLARPINIAALPVNYFARIGMLREYWWNPHLYFASWWARNLGFTLYDVLGLFGISTCLSIAWTARRQTKLFDALLMFGPAAATILVFNYHASSHGYYALLWLPFTMVGAVELALKAEPEVRRPLIVAAAIAVAVIGIAERQAGLLEKSVAREPSAARPLFHAGAPQSDPRDALSRSALFGIRDRRFVGYLGASWLPFVELGFRGWVVDPPPAGNRPSRLPESVQRAEEWRHLSERWFRDRLARGMDAVLIERGGAFDSPEVLLWARTAGLRDAREQPSGHILLVPDRLALPTGGPAIR